MDRIIIIIIIITIVTQRNLRQCRTVRHNEPCLAVVEMRDNFLKFTIDFHALLWTGALRVCG